MNLSEITRLLMTRAEEKFGMQRAAELRKDIEQLAAQLYDLNTAPLEIEDGP